MSNYLLGWEKYALDEEGEEYIKERFVFPAGGLHFENLYTEEKVGEYFTIYDKKGKGERIDLAKIPLEEGERINIVSEHY